MVALSHVTVLYVPPGNAWSIGCTRSLLVVSTFSQSLLVLLSNGMRLVIKYTLFY